MAYDGERADARALDQLETILRHVADELESWHGRALKTEAELREHLAQPRTAGGAAAGRLDPELKNRLADLEQENKQLRTRVEAARQRVGELLGRLTFLEDQAREQNGGGKP
ncbi:MAG TPA: hypothetical protein VLT79_07235 [Gemmatimonadales bacterium]|nr:hypothetical protein [Gemmatimonadales bacterium]